MEFIKLKKEEDLKVVKSLVDYKEYFESDDIMWDRSVKCIADNGDLLGFALVKPHSLITFFDGDIPTKEGVSEDSGLFMKQQLEIISDKHYETLFYVNEIGDMVEDVIFQHELSQAIKMDENGSLYGVFWTKKKTQYMSAYVKYKDGVYMDVPYFD